MVGIITKATRMAALKSALSDSCRDRLHKTTEKRQGSVLENPFTTVFSHFHPELASADLTAQVMSWRHETCFVEPQKFPLQDLSCLPAMQMLLSACTS